MLGVNVKLNRKDGKDNIVIFGYNIADGHSEGIEIVTDKVYKDCKITDDASIISVFSLTEGINKINALKLIESIQKDARYDNLDLRIIKREDYHILAEGNSQDLKKLPKQFKINGNNNISGRACIKNQIGLPFSMIEKIEYGESEINYVGRKLSMQEFVGLKTYSFDTEFMFWEKEIKLARLDCSDKEIIDFLVRMGENREELEKFRGGKLVEKVEEHFNSNKGNEELGYYEKPMSIQIGCRTKDGFTVDYFEHLQGKDKVIETELISGKTEIRNHKSEDPINMMIDLQKFLDENPFLIFITQNGMSYDLKQLRKYNKSEIERAKSIKEDIGLNEFNVGGEKPVVEGSSGFFHKVVIPTIYHIDMAPYSQNYFPFTINNKFETITSLILGRQIKKKEGYEDLTRMSIEQIIGREESADQLRIYGCEDVTALNELEEYIKPIVYLKCKLFGKNPEDICVTAKSSLGMDAYEMKKIIENLEPVKMNKKLVERYNDISASKTFFEMVDKDIKKRLSKGVKKDLLEAGIYYLAPFTSIFSEELNKDENIKEIFEYIKRMEISESESSNQRTLARFDLINTIEEGYLLPYLLLENWGEEKSKKIEELMERFEKVMKDFTPLNYCDGFYCFAKTDIEKKEFQEAIKGLGFKVAEGKMLNVSRGQFIMHDSIGMYKKGIDIKGAHGFKTIYQKELINEYIGLLFEKSPEEAVRYIGGFFKDLLEGKVQREKMIHFKAEVARDYFNYSSYAQRQTRIQAYIEDSMSKGQKFAKVHLNDGWHDVDDFLEMEEERVFSPDNLEFLMNDYLGNPKNKGRSLSKGKIGKFLEPLFNYLNVEMNFAVKCIEEGKPEKIL